ncbi:hypothetical protein Tco_0630727 [Tanacetum coccineum]
MDTHLLGGKISSSYQAGGAMAGAWSARTLSVGTFISAIVSAQIDPTTRHTCRYMVLEYNWSIQRIYEVNPLLILIILKTFECLWRHTFHAKPWENEFESCSGQCLSKYVRQLILCPHEIQLNHSIFHLFFDEMMSDVDVFRPGVLDVVAAESYGTLVVTIQRDMIVCKDIIQ